MGIWAKTLQNPHWKTRLLWSKKKNPDNVESKIFKNSFVFGPAPNRVFAKNPTFLSDLEYRKIRVKTYCIYGGIIPTKWRHIYIWRHLTGMIPPTEDLPFCSKFSIREIIRKIRFKTILSIVAYLCLFWGLLGPSMASLPQNAQNPHLQKGHFWSKTKPDHVESNFF